jgi:hypothetical protein
MEMGPGDESNGLGMPCGTKTGKCLWNSNEIFHINITGNTNTHIKLRSGNYYLSGTSC